MYGYKIKDVEILEDCWLKVTFTEKENDRHPWGPVLVSVSRSSADVYYPAACLNFARIVNEHF